MKFAVLRFPGSNCDADCLNSVRNTTGHEAVYVWHQDRLPSDIDVAVLPGGFSYGDYLRAGAIARFSPVMQDLTAAAERGLPVLGICNGMQILVEAGLLPGAMLQNDHGHFVCQETCLRVDSVATPFTALYSVGQVVRMPVAHGEGRWYADPKEASRVEAEGLIVFRYCEADGTTSRSANPNGAILNVAGLRNSRGNVVGLMPHPERACDELLGSVDGAAMFVSCVQQEAGRR